MLYSGICTLGSVQARKREGGEEGERWTPFPQISQAGREGWRG